MTRIFVLAILFLNCYYSALAQSAVERSALRNINKQRWQPAHEQLKKASAKDSVSPVTEYIYTLYFLSNQNPHYNIDSANHYASLTLHDFTASSAKLRDQMKRLPLDSITILKLQTRIDSSAFERARNLNTEKDYLHFLSNYPYAKEWQQAIELRNAAAYQETVKENTYQGFLQFLQTYPEAKQVAEAQRLYDQLLFEQKTEDRRLVSYEEFLNNYPTTPYREKAQRNIFEIMTAPGDATSFELFIEKYPQSSFVQKAKNILFHILLEDDALELPVYLDSLKRIQIMNQSYIIPFLKDGKFSFMNDEGVEVIQTSNTEIDKDYLCGNITTDILILPDGIMTKSGSVIFKGSVNDVEDLGYGFLKVTANDTITVLHKSGFGIEEQEIQDAKIIDGKFIAIKHEDRWGLWTLAGRKLMPYDWDDVTGIAQVVAFKKSGKYKLAITTQLAQIADQQSLKTGGIYDDVKPLAHDLIWIRGGDKEGILDQSLKGHVAFEKHQLTPTPWGVIGLGESGQKIYNTQGKVSGFFDNVKTNDFWVAVKNNSTWRFFDVDTRQFLSQPFDSVSFMGTFAVGHLADTVSVFLQNHLNYKFQNAQLEFIPGKDSTSFLQVREANKKTIYDANGIKLFTVGYDKILYVGSGIFIVTKKEKKGLINSEAKVLLPLEYDAIGGLNNHTISVLKNSKFGLFDISQNKLIKPQYNKNIIRYNEKLLIGFKNGFFGFINWSTKPVSKFAFEEIMYWNDTAALVKSNAQWMLYNITNQRILLDEIKDCKLVSDVNGEKVFIVNQQDSYGVVSNVKGIILPVNFSHVKNLGSIEKPLYITEKHVEEASIFVVIYYDSNGKLLSRQVFEEDEYEKIYCSD